MPRGRRRSNVVGSIGGRPRGGNDFRVPASWDVCVRGERVVRVVHGLRVVGIGRQGGQTYGDAVDDSRVGRYCIFFLLVRIEQVGVLHSMFFPSVRVVGRGIRRWPESSLVIRILQRGRLH